MAAGKLLSAGPPDRLEHRVTRLGGFARFTHYLHKKAKKSTEKGAL
jgi:hypothetical protein